MKMMRLRNTGSSTYCTYCNCGNTSSSVLPGPTKPSLPLHPKMTAILAPFTATRTLLLVQPHISAQVCSYNYKILILQADFHKMNIAK
jgi:hypothetical protein